MRLKRERLPDRQYLRPEYLHCSSISKGLNRHLSNPMNSNPADFLSDSTTSQQKQLDAGVFLFQPGDSCNHFVLVTKGSVRVELLSTTGHQLLLYRINAGQSCVMTTACLMGSTSYTAQALTESPVDLVLLPASEFRKKLDRTPEFRNFVFNGFADRLSAMMQRTMELVSHSVDQRLAAALVEYTKRGSDDASIELTHEQLAIEIGTSREVITRRLAQMEKAGLVKRLRGRIEVLDLPGLSQVLADERLNQH